MSFTCMQLIIGLYVIHFYCAKELVHALRAYIELWMHAESLESMKEA